MLNAPVIILQNIDRCIISSALCQSFIKTIKKSVKMTGEM